NSLLIRVTDTGIGIEANDLTQIGDPFFQASASYNRAYDGTGLGLSICKHVLNLHQAELRIESTPGKGSRFLCRFPPERVA
ncbi:MAG: ATP-binding protein, partial [Novosphingobium sp.]